ncbi:MAG: 2-methylaconitate cis-trans isomerase PrpF family protein [Desulfatirhabdiaceae bacterium]
MQDRIQAVMMRGGTSRGLFFHENHLPSDPAVRDRLILAAYGSPDPYHRQMNGVGGGISQSSKTAIISPSNHPDYDVEYYFGQVSIDRPIIEYTGNCGNLSAAVGPFAVDEGLVRAVEPVTRVRIFQKNTNKLIIAEVPVTDGCFNEAGDYSISGIPGAGSKITLRFADPGGSMTGKLLPTGHVQDCVTIPDLGTIPISIVDAANPVVFVQASQIGLSGKEIDEMDTPAIREKLEAIRSHASVLAGLTESPGDGRKKQTVPKMAVVSPPQSYRALNQTGVDASGIDLTVRMMSMGKLHRSYAVTGAICTVGAAMIPGTVVHEVVRSESTDRPTMLLGHPGGAIEVGAVLENGVDGYLYQEAVVGRTARRLMDGYVRVPKW